MNRLLDIQHIRNSMEKLQEIEETFKENTADDIIKRLSEGGFNGSEDVFVLLTQYREKFGDPEVLTEWWLNDGTREGLVAIIDGVKEKR